MTAKRKRTVGRTWMHRTADPFNHDLTHCHKQHKCPTWPRRCRSLRMQRNGSSACRLAPKVASAKLQKNEKVLKHVQFESLAPPNEPLLSNQTTGGTIPIHVAPPVSLTAPTQSHFVPTRFENMSLPASLPKLKLADFSGDPLK